MVTITPSVIEKGIYTLKQFGDHVLIAFSGREFPLRRHKEFLSWFGIEPTSLRVLNQVHSANLILIDHAMPDKGVERPRADGMITALPGVAMGIYTADCVPLYFWDSEKHVAAIAHAGWRGIYHGIAAKVVRALRQNFLTKPETVQVIFGPAIRECCYEVGEEFKTYFPLFYKKRRAQRTSSEEYPSHADRQEEGGVMDLVGALTHQLTAEGIPAKNLWDTGLCTSCQNERFFSARCEKKTAERILSVIQIRSPSTSLPDVI